MKDRKPKRSILPRKNKHLLSVKEEMALSLYVAKKFTHIIECMIEAGYAKTYAKRAGTALLKTKKAKEYLELKANHALAKYDKEADDVLQEVALIGFSDPADLFIKTDKDGIALKSIHDMGPERRAIKKIKHHRDDMLDSNGKTIASSHRFEYELYSKLEALKILAEHHGINEGKGGGEIITPVIVIPDNKRGVLSGMVQ